MKDLREQLEEYAKNNTHVQGSIEPFILGFAKEAVTSALQEAGEKAKTKKTGNSGSWHDASVDKESILSLIPKDK